MLAALTACMAANIITVSEGLTGFSNEGVLTVVVSNICCYVLYMSADERTKASHLCMCIGAICRCSRDTINWGTW